MLEFLGEFARSLVELFLQVDRQGITVGFAPCGTAFATVPEQRRTASLTLALHRIRDTRVHLRAARAGCTIMHSTATER